LCTEKSISTKDEQNQKNELFSLLEYQKSLFFTKFLKTAGAWSRTNLC